MNSIGLSDSHQFQESNHELIPISPGTDMNKVLIADHPDIFVVEDFFSQAECHAMIAKSEAVGFGDAPINLAGGPVVDKKMRNNERVMIDDPNLATTIWDRLRPFVPEKRGTGWVSSGLNERFRFYRYDPGQRFDWHLDGYYERSPSERSAYTFMIYLNEGFAGGSTEFMLHGDEGGPNSELITRIVPKTGMALVFFHRMPHQGAPVLAGRKYVLRSDVMYRWIGT
ncbi:MAG TPA: 2OG-Fe(II) oxygenase [Urbifossiella sp.]